MRKLFIKEFLIIQFYSESKYFFYFFFSKEGLENKLNQLEKDMAMISPNNVIVDMTKQMLLEIF